MALVTLSLASVGVTQDRVHSSQAIITGEVRGQGLLTDVTVTIAADGETDTVFIPAFAGPERGVKEYSLHLESGGEYEVYGWTDADEYVVLPVGADYSSENAPLVELENVSRTVTVPNGETREGVHFSLQEREVEIPPETRTPTVESEELSDLQISRQQAVSLLLLLVIGLLGIQFLRTRSDPVDVDASVEDSAAEQVRRIAGDAADRISDASTMENEVYRAWHEMTRALDVPDPDTATVRDFERAAIDAGLPAESVRRLATLFTDVRYGGKDPDVRAEEAVDILRTIDGDVTDTGDGGRDRHRNESRSDTP